MMSEANRRPQETTFRFVTPLPLTEATALAILLNLIDPKLEVLA